MRNLSHLLFSFLLITQISCSDKDEDLAIIDVDLNGNIKAFLDGTEWTSGPNTSAALNPETMKVHIEGFDANEGIVRSHISIIVNSTTTGTFDAQSAKGIFYDVQTKKTYISNNNCNVDILSLNIEEGSIDGRFSFSGIELNSGEIKEVMSGEFSNVNLTLSE